MEMKYQKNHIRKILKRGAINGLEYVIVSYGTHPCAYINLDMSKIELDVDYNIDVHGGITFNDYGMVIGNKKIFNNSERIIGWDYAHSGDKYGNQDGIKYTVNDIMLEVRYVISQLKKLGF